MFRSHDPRTQLVELIWPYWPLGFWPNTFQQCMASKTNMLLDWAGCRAWLERKKKSLLVAAYLVVCFYNFFLQWQRLPHCSSLQFQFALHVLNLEIPSGFSYESPPQLSSSWIRFLLPPLILGSDKETKCPLGFCKSLWFLTWSTRVYSWTIFWRNKVTCS